MEMNEGVWSRMPSELIERVLSLLPVPVLCRFRSVCKTWRQLFRTPSFLDLCDRNGTPKEYLFLARCLSDPDDGLVCSIDEAMTFLDIEAGRWYWIKSEHWRHYSFALPHESSETRLLAMDESLVCEFTALPDDPNKGYAIFISDPIAKTAAVELPPVPSYRYSRETSGLPTSMTIDVDKVAYTFKVFLNCDLRWYVYESSIGVWRDLGTIPDFQHAEVKKSSTPTIFHGILYTIAWLPSASKFVVFSYNLQTDEWRALPGLRIPSHYYDPQLLVVGNRLFAVSCVSSNVPNSEFEVMEVLVGKNEARVVVHIPNARLLEYFDEGLPFCVFGFPIVDSQGVCKAIVLKSDLSGKLVMYEMACGEVEVLPAHPMGPAPVPCCWKELGGLHYPTSWVPFTCYGVGYGNLSMRNYLSPPAPVT